MTERLCDPKTEAIVRVIQAYLPGRPSRILVVGCGSGVEAAILAQQFDAEVIGIDLTTKFDSRAARIAKLQGGDATNLAFPDDSFDLVFSYHALEHIPRYRVALCEMRRVLAPHGTFMVGTPNRLRLLGYLGSRDATLAQKIVWNATEWVQRARGHFTNEHGAHAGFSPPELMAALLEPFSTVRDVSVDYYRELYARHARVVELLQRSQLARFAYPSVYCFGSR